MTKDQIELIRQLAEVIRLIASEPESYDVEYIKSRYLWNITMEGD